MEDIGSRVIRVIAAELVTRPARLTRATEFLEDLQLDSLEIECLVLAIEEEFCIVVPQSALPRLVTIGDAVEFVEEALQARPPSWRTAVAPQRQR
ncbi:MAG TPA: hypothetical protein VJM11_05410 [Nevskiaceae bacterium]|nr:hypothetical protein [Nevskiaceae bacterium]